MSDKKYFGKRASVVISITDKKLIQATPQKDGDKMIFTDDDRKFIKDNFQNSDELLSETDVRKVLDAISNLIDEKGFELPDYYDYNNFGRKAQKVHDSIYENN